MSRETLAAVAFIAMLVGGHFQFCGGVAFAVLVLGGPTMMNPWLEAIEQWWKQ